MTIIYTTKVETRKSAATKDCARIGQCMAHVRKKHGFTQADVATYVGVHPTCISSWETSKTVPGLQHFFMWCDALSVAPEDAMTVAYGD